MASIRERNGKFNVIYSYTDPDGKRKQKWETYTTKAEAKKRKKEIEYKEEMGSMVIPQCKTMRELPEEYVALYGKDNWALSTYDGNVSLINNYILPIIGDVKLAEINTRFIEKYYKRLLKTPAVINPMIGKRMNEYESLEVTHHDDMRQVDEIVNLIVETVMCKNDKILIASNWYPASLVKKKFLMLTYSHIEYVLHCMRGNTTKVKNIKKCLLAALFNAPSTMNGYYQAEVNHDMPGLVR